MTIFNLRLRSNVPQISFSLSSMASSIPIPFHMPSSPAAAIRNTQTDNRTQLSLSYPSIFTPSITVFLSFALLIAYSFTRLQPKYSKNTIFSFLLILFDIKRLFCTILIALLTNQEYQLERRLIVDFRQITNGFWSTIDDIVFHYIQIRPSTSVNMAKNNGNNTEKKMQFFHGFGANCLSWDPLMRLIGKPCM